MNPPTTRPRRRLVLMNVGHYRTGSTTLATAAHIAGLRVHREFPELSPELHRQLLVSPGEAVHSWWNERRGKEDILETLLKGADVLGDGWIPLLPFLGAKELGNFKERVWAQHDIDICFVATTRPIAQLVRSELRHWVEWDLERRASLSFEGRRTLESCLRKRATDHEAMLTSLEQKGLPILRLALDRIDDWPILLRRATQDMELKENVTWEHAFERAGQQNESRELPTEGLLLTFRLDDDVFPKIEALLVDVTADSLAKLLVVVALDDDQFDSADKERMVELVQRHCSRDVILLRNPPRAESTPFPACHVWNRMAVAAFEAGADWVVFLGDDIKVNCPFHYRATYRAFLDIHERLGCPLYFGCPWWNDTTFPGFPTFPIVGRAHFDVFGALIPPHRMGRFVNQDLDPYLQRLYLQFGAAPLLEHAHLRNEKGGNHGNPTRYERVPAEGWRDWVLDDAAALRHYIVEAGVGVERIECVLLDVVIPSYRVNVEILAAICSMRVPERFRTTFIVIVDNPVELTRVTNESDVWKSAASLEALLVARSTLNHRSPNNIRVRCNPCNMGASASRNRGMDESAAEYILFLDDDVQPADSLLEHYDRALTEIAREAGDGGGSATIVGLVGLVRFPRRADLPIIHAAVLMSYLTFMFEIAANDKYASPAWGVTANLLVKRLRGVRFDTAYAKTGGGEDVDFCLRAARASGGQFKSVREAQVGHDFWPGGLAVLIPHFYRWAIGDGALFQRYPEHRYLSWPNLVESFVLFFMCWLAFLWVRRLSVLTVFGEAVLLFVVDTIVEATDRAELRNKRLLLEHRFSDAYCACAHVVANLFVMVLECGRFAGHVQRGEAFGNALRRFDWHCGRLPHARSNFRRKERTKFLGFVAATVAYHYWLFHGFRAGAPTGWNPWGRPGAVLARSSEELYVGWVRPVTAEAACVGAFRDEKWVAAGSPPLAGTVPRGSTCGDPRISTTT